MRNSYYNKILERNTKRVYSKEEIIQVNYTTTPAGEKVVQIFTKEKATVITSEKDTKIYVASLPFAWLVASSSTSPGRGP
jgi:hypothetical protein